MAAAQRGSLLRILRNDTPDPDQYVLLHITPTSSSQPLNLQLHATDGERAFGLKLKQNKIDDLRAKSYTGSVSELEQIFSSLLLKTTAVDPQLIPRGVELAASVDSDYVTLTIRQDIGGIKQRIAALKVPEVEDDIPIFEWAVESCGVLDESSTETQSLQSRITLKEKEIAKLTNQLTALVELKREHEEILLVKFSELLNSKKSKIRELSRALEASNSVAPSSVAPAPAAPEESEVVAMQEPDPQPARTTRSRATPKTAPKTAPKTTTRKRKPVAPPSDSESDGFVKMDLDPKGKSAVPLQDETEDSEDSEGGAPNGYIYQNAPSDRSAAEDDDELPPPRRFEAFTLREQPARSPVFEEESQTQAGDEQPKAPTRARGRSGRARGGRGRGRGKAASPESQSPPPRRQPARGKAKESSPEAGPAGDGSGGDTDDDEL